MRDDLQKGVCNGFDEASRADIDEYLSVALSLLRGGLVAPVAGGDGARVQQLVDTEMEANGLQELLLFGSKRTEDMSQFMPRGHYTKSVQLERYFRAMMWLGRIDLRLIETQGDGSQVFRPRATLRSVAAVTPEGACCPRADRTAPHIWLHHVVAGSVCVHQPLHRSTVRHAASHTNAEHRRPTHDRSHVHPPTQEPD